MSAPVRGLVLGKFLPPHAGHVFLCETALRSVDELCIVVGSLASEPIPGRLRAAWMRELFPGATVVHLDEELPQHPGEAPDFWDRWRTALQRVMPWRPDLVFASEDYGTRLASELGAVFRPVDRSRVSVPVSGSSVRVDPCAAWDEIPAPVRPWFVKRVAIVGAESTGKSTLASALAAHFGTRCVPEYARLLLETKDGRIDEGDFEVIAQGQAAMEEALARSARRVLVCDTDLLLTTHWAEELGMRCDPWVREAADARDYDMYYVTGVDVPYVPDAVRYRPDTRRAFHERVIASLRARGRRFVVLDGPHELRLRNAIAALEPLLGPDAPRPVRQQLLARDPAGSGARFTPLGRRHG